MRFTGGKARRVTRVMLYGLALAHVLEALRLRRRREQLVALPVPPDVGAQLDEATTVTILAREGFTVDEGTCRAVAAEMRATEAEVIDLVPCDLSVERALTLLRRVDPARLDTEPMYLPGGAHEAVVVGQSVADRMGVPDEAGSLSCDGLVHQTRRAQRYAVTSKTLRLAPDLRSAPMSARERWLELRETTAFSQPYGSLTAAMLGIETIHLAALTAGLFVAPLAGAAAVAAWSAQPALVLAGTKPDQHGLAPSGLLGRSVLRLPRGWIDNICTAIAGCRETAAEQTKRADRSVQPPVPAGDQFDPGHETCPWCGSPALIGRFDVPDFFQHKPVTTHLDECATCGHVFQNPPLSLEWLDYCYKDFYDGVGAETAELCFAGMTRLYLNRARAVGQFTRPKAWLDVGGGYGHFCAVARREWPEANFDALDLGATIEEGDRRGWVDTAHRGLFPEVAEDLPRYDVVSMYHYLEHTRDPHQELVAASKVLDPGGYLTIEVPDPECWGARQFGRFWFQWSQPQHQHFVPCDNLVARLDQLDFETVSIERGPAALGGDFSAAVIYGIQNVTRSSQVPWLPAPSLADRAKRIGVIGAGLPVLLVARLMDLVRDARLGPDDVGNSYRIVARRR